MDFFNLNYIIKNIWIDFNYYIIMDFIKVWLSIWKTIFGKILEERKKNKNISEFLDDTLNKRKEKINIESKYHIQLLLSDWNNDISVLWFYNKIGNNNLLITWNPWSWKTELMVEFWLKFNDWINSITLFQDFLPFFIPLRNLWTQTLTEYIQNKIQQFNLPWSQKFILLLDWLDEISLSKTELILNELWSFSNYKFIISSRKSSINLWLLNNLFNNIEKYNINELNFFKIKEYFKNKWKKINELKYNKLNIIIKDVYLLNLFYEVYEKLSENDWKIELIEKYVTNLVEDEKNKLYKYSIDWNIELINLLTNIAGILYKDKSLLITKNRIKDVIERDLNYTKFNFFDIKDFIEALVKTFFIETQWKYSFIHKIIYEYFLVKYIIKEYNSNKLSIRNWNILLDNDFMKNLFFPYLKKEYVKKWNYNWVIGLNILMKYYLDYNPIDEVDNETIIKSLLELPEDIVRFYILSEDSPIFKWFDNFSILNWNIISIILDNGYEDIANDLHEKLNKKIRKTLLKEKNLLKEINDIEGNNQESIQRKIDLENTINSLFLWLNEKNKAYFEKKINNSSYFQYYIYIKNNLKIVTHDIYNYNSNNYEDNYYSFYENIINYWNLDELKDIIFIFNKDELYLFLKVWYKINNIVKLLWNIDLLLLVKEKFIELEKDFKKEDEIILFSKYIFWFDKKSIFENENYKKLKDFNRFTSFDSYSISKTQLISYIFIEEINFDIKEKPHLSQSRLVYQYSYYLYIKLLLNNEKFDFISYIDDIFNYLNSPRISSNLDININSIFWDLLAYIFIFTVDNSYQDNLDEIIKKLWKYFNKYNFFKTLKDINKGIFKELEIWEVLMDLKREMEENYNDYPNILTSKNLFLSECYWINNDVFKQIEIFESWLSWSYLRYWFRKDTFLLSVFYILKELKNNILITEIYFFEYLDKIIELYNEIDSITEKWVKYLWLEIVNYILTFNIRKAEEYSKKIYWINEMFYEKIEINILIEKIKKIYNYNNIESYIDNLYYSWDKILHELRLYLYLIKNYSQKEKYFIKLFNEKKKTLTNVTYFNDYWNEEDLNLYNELFKLWKIEEFKIASEEFNKLKNKNIPISEKEILKEVLKLKEKPFNKDEIFNELDNKYFYLSEDNWKAHSYLYFYEYYNDITTKQYMNEYLLRFYKDWWDTILDYRLFSNIEWYSKVLVKSWDKKNSIKLFEEAIWIANLLIK